MPVIPDKSTQENVPTVYCFFDLLSPGTRPIVQNMTTPYLLRHGDTLPIDEGEDLVVVHDRVHGLYPQCVHWPIEDEPLLIGLLVGTCQSHDAGQHTISPLTRVQVKLTIKFPQREGLGVDGKILQEKKERKPVKCSITQL